MASRSSNRAAVPEAKGALDKFKYEVANELGVPLTDGYNGDLTSRQNGSCLLYTSPGIPYHRRRDQVHPFYGSNTSAGQLRRKFPA